MYEIYCNICDRWVKLTQIEFNLIDTFSDEVEGVYVLECDHNIKIKWNNPDVRWDQTIQDRLMNERGN